jgi:hypothetical protein
MANTNIDLVGLDFASMKSNLKSFLKNNTQFKDIDFEGSNINVLLDLLAYNTYLNGFYTNMVASEMFLDTAQLRDSVVSHAKELNYTPRSFTAAKAKITVDITPAYDVSSVVVPKFTSFTSKVGSNTYSFTTNETLVATNLVNSKFTLDVDVYEGVVTTESFVVNNQSTRQRFVISNPTVDASILDVTVYEDNGQTSTTFTPVSKIINLTSTSPVYFVQAAENQQFEILFGDGVFGRRPKDGSTVVVRYRACSGELPNGALRFISDGPIDGHSSVAVTTVSAATGGAVAETVESIRFNAPRSFQSQNRAVTSSDYETLLLTKFPEIQSISVYGGEEADPPQYGRVFVSVDVADADGAPQSRKDVFYDYIKDRTPLTIDVNFVNPDFLYVRVQSDVLYDVTKTSKTTADIKSLVQASISDYNNVELEDFKTTLFYSALCSAIDGADSSILSNDTTLTVIKRVAPKLGQSTDINFSIGNALSTETGKKLNVSEAHYGHTLTTTTFTYQNASCTLVDDTLGNVFVAAQQADSIQIIKKVGNIDYITGKIAISGLNIAAYSGSYIEFRLKTASKNISSLKNMIIKIDPADVTVNVAGAKL